MREDDAFSEDSSVKCACSKVSTNFEIRTQKDET